MKIAHIAFADTGGASAAAYRLHESLLMQGVDSSFYVVEVVGKWPGINILKKLPLKLNLVRNGMGWLMQKLINRTCKMPSVIHVQWRDCGYISSIAEKYDILHFHWVDSHVASIFEIACIENPIVWTLHDMRPFTGGHYYKGFGVQKNGEVIYESEHLEKNVFIRLNRWVKNVMYGTQKIHAIAPSIWMHREAKKSGFYSEDTLHHIPYGIAPIETPLNTRIRMREKLSLGINDKVLLYGADSVGYPRKGHDLLIQALDWLTKNNVNTEKIHLFTFGKGEFTASSSYEKNHRHFGHIGTEAEMNELFAVADLFVAPSREDNLPNVVLESLRCGTQVVAYDIGGMPDMINHGVNGRLAKPFSPKSLGQEIRNALVSINVNDITERQKVIEDVTKRFSLEQQLVKTLTVYRKLNNCI